MNVICDQQLLRKLRLGSCVLPILTCVTPKINMILATREMKLVEMRTISRTLAAEKRRFIINCIIVY